MLTGIMALCQEPLHKCSHSTYGTVIVCVNDASLAAWAVIMKLNDVVKLVDPFCSNSRLKPPCAPVGTLAPPGTATGSVKNAGS